MRTRMLRPGLISLCLLALAGCSATPEPIIVTKTETVVLTPPPGQPAAHPAAGTQPPIEQNRDLRNHVEQLHQAIGQCNGDKRAVRQWTHRQGGSP